MKRNALLLTALLALVCAALGAETKNAQSVRAAARHFFEAGGQEYVELLDEENDDLYFLGERDLFVYPALWNGLSYGHYAFAGNFSSLDDFDLDGDIDFRSFSDSPYTALKSGTAIMLRRDEGSYSLFTFKETLSAKP